MANRPSTQASYTIGLGTTMQENQPAAQIAAEHNIFYHMAPYMSRNLFGAGQLVGIDRAVSRLEGKIVYPQHHGWANVSLQTRSYSLILTGL